MDPNRFKKVCKEFKDDPPGKLYLAHNGDYSYVVETLENGIAVQEFKSRDKARERYQSI